MDPIPNPSKYDRTDLWREGKWLDLWSVVHFMSGLSVGLGFYFLHFDALAATALALLGLVAYEMWEVIVKIEEKPTNRFMDVVVGMVSFVPAFFLFAPRLTFSQLSETLAFVLALNITLSVIGWRVSQKAIELQKRMRARFEVERKRLLQQKAHLRDKIKR